MALTYQDASYGAEYEYRIALIGRTGSGKSSSGNSILGRKAFISKLSASSVTTKCQFQTAERYGKKLVVADTPGIFDTVLPQEVVTKEVIKCVGILTPGPHAFVLVVQVGRFTQEEHDAIIYFSRIFGEEFFRYLIVLFTRKDDLENDGMTIQEYATEVPDNLKSILQRCNHRYLAFDNTLRGQKNDLDVRKLVSMVKDIMDHTGKSYFSNGIFERAELEFQRRAKEIRHIGEEKIAQIQEELKAEQEEIEKEKREARTAKEEIEKEKRETRAEKAKTEAKKQKIEEERRAKEIRHMGKEKISQIQEELKAEKEEIEKQKRELRIAKEELEKEIRETRAEEANKRKLEEEQRRHKENIDYMRDNDRGKYENEDEGVLKRIGNVMFACGKNIWERISR